MGAELNRGLIIPYYWGKTFLCALPGALGIIFSSRADGTSTHLSSVWELETVTSNLLTWFFFCFWLVSSHTCPDQTQLNTLGKGLVKQIQHSSKRQFLKHCLMITCIRNTWGNWFDCRLMGYTANQ